MKELLHYNCLFVFANLLQQEKTQ